MCRLSQESIDVILRRGRIYEVGGCVRDRFLKRGENVKDRDYIVTGIPFDDLTNILRTHGRVDLVGRSFGVIKFTQLRKGESHTFDISLPRKEHSTGLAHTDFAVDFDPTLPIEDDLARRDFTVNAMALALDNDELVDPLHGLIDLENHQLRMTSPASFSEDPLRMLRATQFAARFGFILEPGTFTALRDHASLIRSVSPERIAEELTKLLTLAPNPSDGLRLMQTSGLLKEILPELEMTVGVDQPGGYHRYEVFEHVIRTIDACRPSLRLRLAALFHDICKPQAKRLVDKGATFYGHETTGAVTAKIVMNRLRFPKDLTSEVSTLVERHMFTTDVTDKGLRRLVKRVGIDLIFDLLDLRRADVIAQGMGGITDDVDQFEKDIRDELARKPPFGLGDLALNGGDLMTQFNLTPGPTIGAVLNFLMEKVLDQPEDNTREKLTAYAQEFLLCNPTIVHSINDKDSHR